ncbi:hypothetical protein NQZ68_003501 [Dissostichus eleginoides]|nr:hypothetical protein NQZ68_003501 [Dissostichus eleginoides]
MYSLKLKCQQEQRINWGEITIYSLKEIPTKQMVSTSGKTGYGGALTTKQRIGSLIQGIMKEGVKR